MRPFQNLFNGSILSLTVRFIIVYTSFPLTHYSFRPFVHPSQFSTDQEHLLTLSEDSSKSNQENLNNDGNSELIGILEVLHQDIPGVKVFCGRQMDAPHFNHVLEYVYPSFSKE